MKTWNIKIKLEVSDNWIEDGFNASERLVEIEELIYTLLPYAYNNEVKVKASITKAPNKDEILKLQGF